MSPGEYPLTINPGDSVVVRVEYTPEDLGESTARVAITTNDESDPFKHC